jgi:hypothetical protein
MTFAERRKGGPLADSGDAGRIGDATATARRSLEIMLTGVKKDERRPLSREINDTCSEEEGRRGGSFGRSAARSFRDSFSGADGVDVAAERKAP